MAMTCWFGVASILVFFAIAAAKPGKSLFDS